MELFPLNDILKPPSPGVRGEVVINGAGCSRQDALIKLTKQGNNNNTEINIRDILLETLKLFVDN